MKIEFDRDELLTLSDSLEFCKEHGANVDDLLERVNCALVRSSIPLEQILHDIERYDLSVKELFYVEEDEEA